MNILVLEFILIIIFLATLIWTCSWDIVSVLCLGALLSLLTLVSPISASLDSEHIIKEYIRSSFETEVKEADISKILKEHDPKVTLTELETYQIPNSKSKSVTLKFRKGKYIYANGEYSYIVGENNNNVFIEPSKK